MRDMLLTAVALSATFAAAWGQRLHPQPSPQERGQKLAQVLVASDLVVVGRVVGTNGVVKRLTPEEIKRVWDSVGVSGTYGGALFRFKVTEVLCERGDVPGGGAEDRNGTQTGKTVRPTELPVFVPGNAPLSDDQGPVEWYVPGRSYLLFAEKYPHEEELIRANKLDAGIDYYRAYLGGEGIIEMPKGEQQLARVRKLCEAVRQARLEMKLGMLNQLRGTGDDVLDSAADELIRILPPPKKDASER